MEPDNEVNFHINPKTYNGGDTNKNQTKTTSMRRKVGKTRDVSTISGSMQHPFVALQCIFVQQPFVGQLGFQEGFHSLFARFQGLILWGNIFWNKFFEAPFLTKYSWLNSSQSKHNLAKNCCVWGIRVGWGYGVVVNLHSLSYGSRVAASKNYYVFFWRMLKQPGPWTYIYR